MLTATLLLAAAGCSTFQQMMPSHREAQSRAARLQSLQLTVMRFADEYAGRVNESATHYQQSVNDSRERLRVQTWKVQQSQSVYTIASGSNAVANALDMVVLASLSRMVIDDAWTISPSERFGALRETHRGLEQGAWRLIDSVITEQQQAQVRKLIDDWRAQNPQLSSVAYIHFADFVEAVAGVRGEQSPGNQSLLGLVGMDPLSGLNPAVREITQTRELAERSIFYLQRAPLLLDLEVERLSYQFAVMPEARNLLGSADRISLIGSASDRLVTMLPDLIAHERQALISQTMNELDQRSDRLTSATAEVRKALEAGTQTAAALQETLATLDRLAARYEALQPPSTAATPKKPFDINDYTELLREMGVAATQLNALAQNIDAVLPHTSRTVQEAAGTVRSLIDRVFIEVLVSILVLLVGAVGAALAYRALAARVA